MKYNFFKFIIFIILLLVISNIFIIKRSINLPKDPSLYISDAEAYINMSLGFWKLTPAPFKYRIFLPFIVSIIPFDNVLIFQLITYTSLFISYIILYLFLKKLKIDTKFIYLGFLLIWTSTWHQYYFHNPFLTDALANMFLCLMFYFYFNNSFKYFAIISIFAVLTRETSLLFIPIYFFGKNKLKTIYLIIFNLFLLTLIRYFLFSKIDNSTFSNISSVMNFHINNPLKIVIDVIKSWGIIWFFSILGLFTFSYNNLIKLFSTYLILLCISFTTSLIATDTGRMFSILTPIMLICSCKFLEIFYKIYKYKFVFIYIFICVQYFLSMNNILINLILDNNSIFYLKVIFNIVTYLFTIILAVKYYKNIISFNFLLKLGYLKINFFKSFKKFNIIGNYL